MKNYPGTSFPACSSQFCMRSMFHSSGRPTGCADHSCENKAGLCDTARPDLGTWNGRGRPCQPGRARSPPHWCYSKITSAHTMAPNSSANKCLWCGNRLVSAAHDELGVHHAESKIPRAGITALFISFAVQQEGRVILPFLPL